MGIDQGRHAERLFLNRVQLLRAKLVVDVDAGDAG